MESRKRSTKFWNPIKLAFLQSKIAYTLKSVTEINSDSAMGMSIKIVMMASAGPMKIKIALKRVFISNSSPDKISRPSQRRDGETSLEDF